MEYKIGVTMNSVDKQMDEFKKIWEEMDNIEPLTPIIKVIPSKDDGLDNIQIANKSFT